MNDEIMLHNFSPLRAIFFPREQKHIFIYYVIDPYWHDTGSRNYSGIIMSAMTSQMISLTNVYSTVYSGADQRKHQSSASLAFVRGIHRWPGNSPHKWPVMREKFPFDDVIMRNSSSWKTHSRYLGCWWPSDVRSQGISTHDICNVEPN